MHVPAFHNYLESNEHPRVFDNPCQDILSLSAAGVFHWLADISTLPVQFEFGEARFIHSVIRVAGLGACKGACVISPIGAIMTSTV